jgi:branched-subunit amino acid aminotransferase/4-amino-4-deoxychorismate lyase
MIAWRDGEWIEDGDVLPADDRGLTLGDGLFETMKARNGNIPAFVPKGFGLAIGFVTVLVTYLF